MIAYIPEKILGLLPAYGEIPLFFTEKTIGIGQLYNLVIVFILLYGLYKHRRNMMYFSNGLFKKNNVISIGGKTGNGKSRLLMKIAQETYKKDNNIVIGNLYGDNIDIFYASFDDFCRLQADICLLALHCNFKDKEENEKILKHFKGYFDLGEHEKLIRSIKGIYNIITLGDEFYAYLHNRSFMSNFAKEKGKKLLLDLHQTRHHNQTLLLTSQDTDNLDLDIRQVAHQEIEVKSYILDGIYGFNVHKYLSKKEQIEVGKEFMKINKIPYLFINYYEINKSIENIYNKFRLASIIIRNIFMYNILRKNKKEFNFRKIKLFSNKILPYNTKFDIRIDINIYRSGDLFKFILALEKEQELEKIKKANKLKK